MKKGSRQEYYQLSIRFSLETSQLIQDLATKNGRSFSKEVVKLVEAQLAQQEKEVNLSEQAETAKINQP